jgi:GxxExxY protein
MTENELATAVLDCAFEIHRTLGPGLLESAYQKCLFHDLKADGFEVKQEVLVPIQYKNLKIDQGYRIDLLVENKVVIELKAVEQIMDKHKAQTLTYLRLGDYKMGLLINFNEKLLKNGIKRIANNL